MATFNDSSTVVWNGNESVYRSRFSRRHIFNFNLWRDVKFKIGRGLRVTRSHPRSTLANYRNTLLPRERGTTGNTMACHLQRVGCLQCCRHHNFHNTCIESPHMASLSSPAETAAIVAAPNAASSSSSSSIDRTWDNWDILTQILSFVGRSQYRFVAGINRRFQKAYHKTFPYDRRTALNASTVGHARICWSEYASNFGRFAQRELGCSAAAHGNVEALQYLQSVNCHICMISCSIKAVRKGHLDVLKWCRKNGYQLENTDCKTAAYCGHLHILQWCRENDCPWNEWTCVEAASSGHFTLLQWCRENGCPWDELTCLYVAESGLLDILKWCREHGCPWDKRTCAKAALNGHLIVLQWCRENGCPWDESTCSDAAKNGHLDVLQWCRDNGCPWSESTGIAAAKGGHLNVLQWCLLNGCPFHFDIVRYATEKCNFDVEPWCLENGITTRESPAYGTIWRYQHHGWH